MHVGHGRGEGRVLLVALAGEEVGVVEHQRAARANHCLAVADGIERYADVGRELPEEFLVNCRANALVAVVESAGGGVGIDGAGRVGEEVGHVEYNAAIEVVVRRNLRAPAQAADERQAGAGVEGVLNVEAGNRPAQRVLLLLALLEWSRRSQRSHQEVEVLVADGAAALGSAAAVFAVEGEDAVAFVHVADVELVLHPFAAERDLVLAAHPGHVVVDGPGIVVEVGHRVGAAADGELAFGHLQAVGLDLVESVVEMPSVVALMSFGA